MGGLVVRDVSVLNLFEIVITTAMQGQLFTSWPQVIFMKIRKLKSG
jgi:hypothetical protein